MVKSAGKGFSRRQAGVVVGLVFLFLLVGQAGYSPSAAFAQGSYVGYTCLRATHRQSSAEITVDEPACTQTDVDGWFEISGSSVREKIWACVKGPGGEVNVYPIEVKEGKFAQKIWLRYGSGSYGVWVDGNPRRYSGEIYFTVVNSAGRDIAFEAPSGYINCDDPEIIALAQSITASACLRATHRQAGTADKGAPGEREKALAIHDWVAKNISYDYTLYKTGDQTIVNTSKDVLKAKTGLCRDYAFLTAALGRAAGIKTRVVYGQAKSSTCTTGTADRNDDWINHAWNEMCLDGKWVAVDASWDAGYIKNGRYVKSPAPARKFFAFATGQGTTHVAGTVSRD